MKIRKIASLSGINGGHRVKGLTLLRMSKKEQEKARTADKFLIEPTTEARMAFVAEFIPKWMTMFEGDEWEVTHRLCEEIKENFQFRDAAEVGLNDGLLTKDLGLSDVIVQQQWMIYGLRKELKAAYQSLRRELKAKNRPSKK